MAASGDEEVIEEISWSVTTTKMLIAFYKDNRLLWDKDHKDYGKKAAQKKALTPLLAKLEKSKAPHTLEDVKKRWHSLRSSALRYMKKTTVEGEVKWLYWNDLIFLREKIAEDDEEELEWSVEETEVLISFFQENPTLWNHNHPSYFQNANKDLLYDILVKELEDKFEVEKIKKKWSELLKKFKQEHSKASIKPSGSGTDEIYKPTFEFYQQLKFVDVICDDSDETMNSLSTGPSKPKASKRSKQQMKEDREERKLQLFSEAVSAIKEPPPENKTAAVSEATAFANYVGLTLSNLSPRKYRKAKKCISDILYQIEEGEVEYSATASVRSTASTRFHPLERYSPTPSSSNESDFSAVSGYHMQYPQGYY